MLFVELNESLEPPVLPEMTSYLHEAIGKPLLNHANEFLRVYLDHASRFLLGHIGLITDADQVVDLACGNGVLG